MNRLQLGVASVLLLFIGCSAPDPVARIEDERHPDSDTLIAAASDRDPVRRARAVRAMGRIQSMAYVAALAEAARDEVRPVRLAALFALGQLGLAQRTVVPDAASAACLAHLDDPDPIVVAHAVEALGKLADPGLEDTVVAQLQHPSAAVRAEAATALFRYRFAPVWRGESPQPPVLSAAAVEALIATLGDPDPSVRRAVVYAFSRYGQPEAAPHLARFAEDEDEWTRLFAIRGIGRSGATAVAEAVTAGLEDASERVRSESVVALAALGRQGSLPVSLASDPSFRVRAAVARAFGSDGTPASLATLRTLERDVSATVRAAAIDALARRSGTDYRAGLEDHIADEDWRIRAAAAGAAGHLGPEGLPIIERAWRDRDLRVRVAALAASGGDETGMRLIGEALAEDDLALRGTAVSLLVGLDDPYKLDRLTDAYYRSAGEAWIEVREAVVDTVAGLEGGEPLLRRAAQDDPAASVRDRARSALRQRGIEIPATADTRVEASALLAVRFDDDPIVKLETSQGEIRIRCLASEAPQHVARFIQLVRDGFYDGSIWHRVVSNFVIQGGDPRGDGWGGAGRTLRDEIHPGRYERGTVGMPKAGKDTGSGQIFITHVPTPHLDGNYTVFGRVVAGLEVVDRIEVGDSILRASVE